MRFVILLVCLSATAANAGWFSYDDYEDCMLGRMKGQPQSMYNLADRACSKQFKVEVAVPKDGVEWEFTYSIGTVSVKIASAGDYEVTKAELSFSDKPCSESKTLEDFSETLKFTFKRGQASVEHPLTKPMLKCARVDNFRGIYK